MSLSVQSKAENVATFRYIHVALMEMLARWTPLTPEMEVKVIFGRHIWDLAQQADALGKRTYELRAPLQFSLRPLDAYACFLEDFSLTEPTEQKLQGFYDVVLPGLAVRYEGYLNATDQLLDEPTCRVIRRILGDFTRMCDESEALRNELPNLRSQDRMWAEKLAKRESSLDDIVAHRLAGAVA